MHRDVLGVYTVHKSSIPNPGRRSETRSASRSSVTRLYPALDLSTMPRQGLCLKGPPPRWHPPLKIGLDSVSLLPARSATFPLYAYVQLKNETVLSSQIEGGTQSSLSKSPACLELVNPRRTFFRMMSWKSPISGGPSYGSLKKYGRGDPGCARKLSPVHDRLLQESHARLMARGRGSEKAPGEFRRSQNWIGGTRPGNAQFVPPPPEEVERCMAALCRRGGGASVHGRSLKHDPPPGATSRPPLAEKKNQRMIQFRERFPHPTSSRWYFFKWPPPCYFGPVTYRLLLHQGSVLAQPLLYS